MIEEIILVIFLALCLISTVVLRSKKQCIVDPSLYPEFIIFKQFRGEIFNDAMLSIQVNRWIDSEALELLLGSGPLPPPPQPFPEPLPFRQPLPLQQPFSEPRTVPNP